MRLQNLPPLLLGALVLGACNPTYNWRETPVGNTSLVALLPCRPEQGQRTVAMAGHEVTLNMTGCEAGGATFAVAWADLGQTGQTPAVLAQWKQAMLGNMQASSSHDVPFVPQGAAPLAQSVQVIALGRRQDGSAVAAQGAWFARGALVFHLVVYADRLQPAMTDTFFSGLRFRQ